MKLFTRSILAAVAFSVMAVPMAQAQGRYDGHRQGQQHYGHQEQWKKPAQKRHHAQKPSMRKQHAQHHSPSRHHWSKGKRVPEWQRRQAVRDYHRYGLRRPAAGQQWVRVDNDYLLISLATGIILGMAASR